MGPIEFTCPNIGRLEVIGARLHDGHDFVVRSNAKQGVFDYLIFLDSRGISRKFDGSLADKLITQLAQWGRTYLLVCRPLELTTWATLINFIAINNLSPAKIVTNMGFVDFTPKKLSILQDAVQQVEFLVGRGVAESYFVQNFVSSTSEEIPLYAMSYGDAYRNAIEAIVKRQSTVIINTPLIDAGMRLDRARPFAFFPALADANKFNRSINCAEVIDLPDFDETLSYDAVHYTGHGNELIFEKVKNHL